MLRINKAWYCLFLIALIASICGLIVIKHNLKLETWAVWNNHCYGLIVIGQDWKKTGCPLGAELTTFMASFEDRNLAVEDKTLQVGTNKYYVLISRREDGFQLKNYLCTNDVLIAESTTGSRTIVMRSANGKGWEPKPSAIKH